MFRARREIPICPLRLDAALRRSGVAERLPPRRLGLPHLAVRRRRPQLVDAARLRAAAAVKAAVG